MSVADEIAKLHELLARGAISQAEYERAKARLLDTAPGPGAKLAINRLRRSQSDRWIAGVCGGIGRLNRGRGVVLADSFRARPGLRRHHALRVRGPVDLRPQ
jgi:Short C-terminal domain/PspC domain